MLFNSYEFIFVFLPLALLGFFKLAKYWGRQAAIAWLVLASLAFYGWWNPAYLVLIVSSALFNYAIGTTLSRQSPSARQGSGRRLILTLGIAANLGLLIYFKYAAFLVSTFYFFAAEGGAGNVPDILLPLAISFFTFQQIAYLTDAYYGMTREYGILYYFLFVTFFPQLIAGPIVHHKDLLPQFIRGNICKLSSRNYSIGTTIFAIGLFKKVILADAAAPYANDVFLQAHLGDGPTLLAAWAGALAYTFQLYFDFSGYSDMAIGLARMFGVRLPVNFRSPYKSSSIIEFWRRWHITLSRFLKDYLYIPLGGNRKGKVRRYINLFLTMLLGGLWHGAGWTFVAWGALHGVYLAINHGWLSLRKAFGLASEPKSWLMRGSATALTFFAVVVGWVFFRAPDFDAAIRMLSGMMGANGVALPAAIGDQLGSAKTFLASQGVMFTMGGGWEFIEMNATVFSLAIVAFLFPNTQEIMRFFRPVFMDDVKGRGIPTRAVDPRLQTSIVWRPTPVWGFAIGCVLVADILALTRISEFLYFRF